MLHETTAAAAAAAAAAATVVVITGLASSEESPRTQRKTRLKSRDSKSISCFRVDVLALLGTAAGLLVRWSASVAEAAGATRNSVPMAPSKSSNASTRTLASGPPRFPQQLPRRNRIPPVTIASSAAAAVARSETADEETGFDVRATIPSERDEIKNWNSRDNVPTPLQPLVVGVVSGSSYGMDAGISTRADRREVEVQQGQKKEQERVGPLPARAPPPPLPVSGADPDGFPFFRSYLGEAEADAGIDDGRDGWAAFGGGGGGTAATRRSVVGASAGAGAVASVETQETQALATISSGPQQQQRAGLFMGVVSGLRGTRGDSIRRSLGGGVVKGKGVARGFEGEGSDGGKGFDDAMTGVPLTGGVHDGGEHRVPPFGSKRARDELALLSLLAAAEDEAAAVAGGFALATGRPQSSHDAVATKEGGFGGSSRFLSKATAEAGAAEEAIGYSNHNHKLPSETAGQKSYFEEWRADHYRDFDSLRGRKLCWESEMFWLDLNRETQRESQSSSFATLGFDYGEAGVKSGDGRGGQEVAANAPGALIVAEARFPSYVSPTAAEEAGGGEQATSTEFSIDRESIFLRRRGFASSVPDPIVASDEDFFPGEEDGSFPSGKRCWLRLRKRGGRGGKENWVEIESESPLLAGHLGVDDRGRRFKVLTVEIQKEVGAEGETLSGWGRGRNAFQDGETHELGGKGVSGKLPLAGVGGMRAGIGGETVAEIGNRIGDGISKKNQGGIENGIEGEIRKGIRNGIGIRIGGGIRDGGRGRWRRHLVQYPSEFPGGVELTCNLDVQDGVSMDGPIIREPGEGDVVELGASTNISWSVEEFEESITQPATEDGSTTIDPSSSLDIEKVNVTLSRGSEVLETYFDVNNTGVYRWTVPTDVEQSLSYRVAVWEANSGICGISYLFGISMRLSLNVTSFGSLLRESNASSDSEGTGDGNEIYSCGGSALVTWNYTGLLEEVDVRICRDLESYGDMAGLEEDSSSSTEQDTASVCLEPTTNILANASRLSITLEDSGSSSTCGVYGEDFFARVSSSESGSADVANVSERISVLGGVFRQPNESNVDEKAWNLYDSQDIVWDGLTGAGDEATVDIYIIRRGNASESDQESNSYEVVLGDRRDPKEGKFEWHDPSSAFPEDELDSPDLESEKFYLEMYDAEGGGLLCRSQDFELRADTDDGSWELPFLLALLTPAAVLLLCCIVIFFVACPYYDKIVGQRRRAMHSSFIDVDDTYIIDGEGQPAILALDAQVIPLAHAHPWPEAAGAGGGSMRRVSSGSASSGPWGRAVRAMGQSVSSSVGRTAELATITASAIAAAGTGAGAGSNNGSSSGGGARNGSGGDSARGGQRRGGPGGAGGVASSGCSGEGNSGDNAYGSGVTSAAVAEFAAAVSSVSSYRGMRSGATWAFGGGLTGGSIGRRSSGVVYTTAAAALMLGSAHQNLEEKSEALASAGGGSSNVSVVSTNQTGASEGVRSAIVSSDVARQDSESTGRVETSGDRAGTGSGSGAGAGAGHDTAATTSSVAASSLASAVFPAPAPAGAAVGGGGGLPFLGLGQGQGRGDLEEGSNAASSSWNSLLSSRVDMGMLVREGSGGGLGEGGGGGAIAGRDSVGLGGGGSGWLGRRGSGDRERITTVIVTRVEALQVEIVEVSRAVVINERGFEISTTTPSLGMEIMPGLLGQGSYEGNADPPLDRAPVV